LNLDIRDPILLSTIRPSNIEGYLQVSGWQTTLRDPGVFSIWSLKGIPSDNEVRVPLDVSASGYPQRIKELLRELAAVEQRSELRVFLDFQDWNCDVIRFGYKPRSDFDNFSPSALIEMLENAREILAALACSVIDPQPWFGKRRPKEASQYLEALETSPFEEPLGVRILGRLDQPLFEADQDSFVPLTRRVSLRLRDAFHHLEELLDVSDRNSGNDWLASSLQYGLSANVTESIFRILRLPFAFGGSNVEISLRLSVVRPFAGKALSVWHFNRPHSTALAEISDQLKTFAAGPDERLLFLVSEIKVAKHNNMITGTALIEDEARPIEMSVDDELIKIAQLAHDRNDAVQCSGRLRRRGARRYEVLQPHDFQIVLAEDPTVKDLQHKMPVKAVRGDEQMPLIRDQSQPRRP